MLFLVVTDDVVEGQRCSGSRCGDCLMNEGCVWCKDQVGHWEKSNT